MINKFIQDIADFQKKFELGYDGKPRFLEAKEASFRIETHFEESTEYAAAVAKLDLEKQLDSLVDLVYFALGTAYRQGFPFAKAWDRVHAANMAKRLAVDASESPRGFERDVVKPEGWAAPVLSDLLTSEQPQSSEPRLFVVEGPDGCGKTMFAKELAQNIGGLYWHITRTKEFTDAAWIDYYFSSLMNVQNYLARGHNVVLDRAWPSEYCYGQILRKSSWADILPLKQATRFLNPYFIYCMDSTAQAASSRHKRLIDKAHPYNDAEFKAIYQAYVDFIMDSDKSGSGGRNLTVRLFDNSDDWEIKMNNNIAAIRKAINV